jgi:hypothetical protein
VLIRVLCKVWRLGGPDRTYIFTAPTCTTTPFEGPALFFAVPEPCALNGEFQHFILRFNKISLLCRYQLKEGIGGEREGDFMDDPIERGEKNR